MQDRARQTREHVLRAAMEEFSTNGYAGTTMNAVAARTGMTKGALYGHFASKEELTEAIIQLGHSGWQRLQTEAGPPGAAPLAALRHAVAALARSLREDLRIRAAYRLLMDGAPGGGAARGFVPDAERHLAGLVRQAQDTGAIADGRPSEETARLLLAVVLGSHAAAMLPTGAGFSVGIDEVWSLLIGVLIPAAK